MNQDNKVNTLRGLRDSLREFGLNYIDKNFKKESQEEKEVMLYSVFKNAEIARLREVIESYDSRDVRDNKTK